MSPDSCISCDKATGRQGIHSFPLAATGSAVLGDTHMVTSATQGHNQSVTNPSHGGIRGVPPSYRKLIQIQTFNQSHFNNLTAAAAPEQPTGFPLSDHLLVLLLSSLNV